MPIPSIPPTPPARLTRLHVAALAVVFAALVFSGVYWWRLDETQAELRSRTIG